jgi:hypothetical protein
MTFHAPDSDIAKSYDALLRRLLSPEENKQRKLTGVYNGVAIYEIDKVEAEA